MKKTNESFTPQEDIERTREKAMLNIRDTAPFVRSAEVSSKAVSIRPSPTHEPAMPAEVYYNKMALDADMDGAAEPGEPGPEGGASR